MKLSLTDWFTIGIIASSSTLTAQTYTVRDLGAAPGNTVSKGYALNDLGQAVGTSDSAQAIATLFSGGQAFDLGAFNSSDVSVATGISKSTVIGGWERFSQDSTDHALIWSNGTILDIHSASLFPGGTMALAINGSGVVVGQGNLTSSTFHTFVYSAGKMVDIGPPGAYQATPYAINDAGEIVGSLALTSGGGGAFLYSGGKTTILTSPSGTIANAQGINSNGQIAGTLFFNNGSPAHVAVYNNGVWTDLGGVSGASATHGVGINSSGQVIATAFFPTKSYHPFIPGAHVAYVVQNGSLVNLNSKIPTNSGFTLTDSMAINTSGQILCDAKNSSSQVRAVLLTPK